MGKSEFDFKQFGDSPLAQAVLRTDGCIAVGVNPAHAKVFGLRKGFTVIDSETKGDLQALACDSNRHPSSRLQCCPRYTDKIGAAYSLRSEMCLLETSFSILKTTAPITSGIGFFNVEVKNDARIYFPFRVYSKKVTVEGIAPLVVCCFVPISGVSVVISNVERSNAAPPKKLNWKALQNGIEWLEEETITISQDPGYVAFHEALTAALELLSQNESIQKAKEVVLNRVHAEAANIDVPTTSVSVECLFEDDDRLRLKENITRIRHRLFDVLVLKTVGGRIDELLFRIFKSVADFKGTVRDVAPDKLTAVAGADSILAGIDISAPTISQVGQSVGWKNGLNSYPSRNAIVFLNRTSRDEFLKRLWEDGALKGMPRAFAGELTLIIPSEGVLLLKNHGLEFFVEKAA